MKISRLSPVVLILAIVAVFPAALRSLAQTQTGFASNDISGRWVSVGCETRPNSQYLTRDFSNIAAAGDPSQGTWLAYVTNYTDATCSDISLTFYVDGAYNLSKPSTKVDGATEAYFPFKTIKLTPHLSTTVDFLNSAKPGTCGKDKWQLDVTQDVSITGCSVLGVDLKTYNAEYDIVKVAGDKLYYGTRPADGSAPDKPEKRPTSLQVPLVRAMVRPNMVGRWKSTECEVRPGPEYLMRDMTFTEDSWAGDFPNYADGDCSQPTMTLHLEGPYVLGQNANVDKTTEGKFFVHVARITPHTQTRVDFLNSAKVGTCGKDTWKLETKQDVSAMGCTLLGIDLTKPFAEYEIVRILGDKLYFGARPTDGSNLTTPEKRPTSFQIPIVRQQ